MGPEMHHQTGVFFSFFLHGIVAKPILRITTMNRTSVLQFNRSVSSLIRYDLLILFPKQSSLTASGKMLVGPYTFFGLFPGKNSMPVDSVECRVKIVPVIWGGAL